LYADCQSQNISSSSIIAVNGIGLDGPGLNVLTFEAGAKPNFTYLLICICDGGLGLGPGGLGGLSFVNDITLETILIVKNK